MKVEVGSITEFCTELILDANKVHEGIVRVRVDRDPQQEKLRDQVTFDVRISATALIVGPETEFVLEYQDYCGLDDISCSDKTGSDVAEAHRAAIQRICDSYDLTIRHGRIEL
jgi:hypothetical protein